MIKKVLFLLFNMDEIPTYKERPDLKDCEYVLGRFCEQMIRNSNIYFTREEFVSILKKYCDEKFIDLEIHVVFDVLFSNHIITPRDQKYCFKCSFWIYYFAAHRMHQDPEFAKWVLSDLQYTSYPEIIEFYTGVDRSRTDALKIMIGDISNVCETVDKKCGLPDGVNPFSLARWSPTEEMVDKMQKEIGEFVANSKLPAVVKDQYADKYYDPTRPYNQSIQNLFRDYSLIILMQAVRSGSRALRNSDYVDPSVKKELLQVIMRGWEQMTKVFLVLTPILASMGNADFSGVRFFLKGDFGDSFDLRFSNIFRHIPANVVNLFKNDLSSKKMGPLLFDYLNNESNEIKKLVMIIHLISERPRNWRAAIEDYITVISKGSIYLLCVYQYLRSEYQFSFANAKTLKDIEYLIKMCVAKHLGNKKPGKEAISKVSNDVLPERKSDLNDE